MRRLVETTELLFGEIGAQTGIGPVTIARWTRRFGWARAGAEPRHAEEPARRAPRNMHGHSLRHCERSEVIQDRAGRLDCFVAPAPRNDGGDGGTCFETRPSATPQDDDGGGYREVDAAARRFRRYGPADHEAARALIEGSKLSLEKIELRLGISSLTLWRWTRLFGWNRPEKPRPPGPQAYRSRRRGNPLGGATIATVRDLVLYSDMSQTYIARQAGITQQTVSDWIRKHGWVRPPVPPKHSRAPSVRRAESLAALGDRRIRGFRPEVAAKARELYEQTELPASLIAARAKISIWTLRHWARRHGWTRPRDMPDVYGRLSRRKRRRERVRPLGYVR